MGVKVSIVIPSLNVREYIKECMDSVTGQSLREIEIICVDAGSNDGTREILQSYANRDSRVHILDSAVRSYGYQMNIGIEKSTGEYVGIVESDDYVDKEMFQYLYQQAKKYDVDVAKVDSFSVSNDVNGKMLYEEQHLLLPKDRMEYYKKIQSNEMLCLHLYDSNLWNGIYRRSFFKKQNIRFNESKGAAFQDFGFQQQVHMLADSFVYSDKTLYYYRADREGSSTNQAGWLRFIHQEVQFLEELRMADTPQWRTHREYVIGRVALAFLVELERSIIKEDFMILGVEWLEHYRWLRDRVRKWFKDGDLQGRFFAEDIWMQIRLALYSLESFRDYVYIRERVKKETYDSFIKGFNKNSCVIFGCGIRGKRLSLFLRKKGNVVLGFADNQHDLWGSTYSDIPIYSPQEAVQKFETETFVVANQKNVEDIRKQLLDMGVPERQIMTYEPW